MHRGTDLGKILFTLEWDDGMEISYEYLKLADEVETRPMNALTISHMAHNGRRKARLG